ncbi:hypothetical protein D3C87_77610 [compost metagenome]
MLNEIHQYVDSLFIMECMTNKDIQNKKIIKDEDQIKFVYSFRQLSRNKNDDLIEIITTKNFVIFKKELDFSISFEGEFSSWSPMTKILENYFCNHEGYKKNVKSKSDNSKKWIFNFKDVNVVKEFINTQLWGVWVGK